jgi:hypothetical protein
MTKHPYYTWDIVQAIIEQPHLLGYLCGYKDLTPLHSDWIKYIHTSTAGNDKALMASRSSYKSTAIVIVGAMYRLIRNKNETMAIMRKSYTLATEVLNTVRNLMETPHIHELFRFIWFADKKGCVPSNADWRFNVRKEGSLNISVRTSQSPEPSISALGINSNLTGKHFDFVMMDDVVTLQDRLYQVEREFTKVIISEVRGNVVKKTGYTGIIGTPYFSTDGLAKIEEEGVPVKKYPYQMLPFIKPEEIEKARKSMPDALFKINYELDYRNTVDMLFANPFMGRWDKAHNRDIYAHIDAGYGGEDLTALTIIARMPDNRVNVAGFVTHKHIGDWIPDVFLKLQQYGAHALHMETNADKGLMLEKITAHPLAQTWAIQPYPYRETQNKQDKIATVLKDQWEHLVFATETDERYMSLVCEWNENTKVLDDPPDSLASILRESGFSSGGSWMNLYRAYS